MSRFGNFIRDLFRRSPDGAATLPPQSPPPAGAPPEPPVNAGQPIERTIERQVVPGTILSFTVTEAAYTGPQGSLDRVRDVSGILGGCNHLIENYAQLGGRCPFCSQESQKLLLNGAIDIHTAESHSLFCRDCRVACDGCHRGTCRRHSIQVADGLNLCPDCQHQARRAQLVRRVLQVIAFPFVDFKKDDPPSSGAGK